MSSRNDNSESVGIAILAGGFLVVGAILFALAAFIAAILTVLCFIAWDKPLKVGKFTIEPYEARAFISGGVAGMWLLPIFAAFCTILFQVGIANYAWSYLFLGGYVAGAFGTSWFVAQQAENDAKTKAEIESIPAVVPASRMIEQTPPPYSFATWDDEEELK